MIVHGKVTPTSRVLQERLVEVPLHLRWGGPMVKGALNGSVHLLDGLEQLKALRDAKVSCPQFTETLPVITGGDVWLGRKLNHTQGFDIRPSSSPKIRGKRSFSNSDFFTLYSPARSEWRFHILKASNGEYISIARGRKVWRGEGPEPTEGVIIRSRRLGWHLDHSVDPPKGLRTAAKNACKAVGYELGAVDVLELLDGTACVLEVNSRPAIQDNYTIDTYVKALKGYSK